MAIIKCGSLSMEIKRTKDALKSQRLIDMLVSVKRENPDISIIELNYVAHGFKTAQKG